MGFGRTRSWLSYRRGGPPPSIEVHFQENGEYLACCPRLLLNCSEDEEIIMQALNRCIGLRHARVDRIFYTSVASIPRSVSALAVVEAIAVTVVAVRGAAADIIGNVAAVAAAGKKLCYYFCSECCCWFEV